MTVHTSPRVECDRCHGQVELPKGMTILAGERNLSTKTNIPHATHLALDLCENCKSLFFEAFMRNRPVTRTERVGGVRVQRDSGNIPGGSSEPYN